jgi:Ricin-type beta-trefoil lectin domain/Putative Ig domain
MSVLWRAPRSRQFLKFRGTSPGGVFTSSLGDQLHRFGYRAGAAAACLLGISGMVALGSARAATTGSPAPVSSPADGSSAPSVVAPQALPSAAAKAMNLPAGTIQNCPAPIALLQMQCQSFVHHRARSASGISPAAGGTPLTPVNLQAAYGLTSASASNGSGVTVAIVDAYNDPFIQSDLASYRSTYGLPACAGSGAGCLTVFNQNGQTSPLPTATDTGWEDETALDVEMVSAICPNCAIDLFEAKTASVLDLGTAVNSAAKVTKFVSNSWGGEDYPGESVLDATYFNHPGVAMTFSSGDFGFGPGYPASSNLVTSVGGTYLQPASTTRGWSETVWAGQSTGAGTGTAAGCSSGEQKAAWQADGGCQNRTENDVAAVSDAPAGVATVSSSDDCLGQCSAYGTSVAAPIIAAVYALAGTPVANTYPAGYLYQSGHAAHFNHVTTGRIGACESTRAYLCDATHSFSNGYNGPTGWGTPNGTAAFASSVSGNIVSVFNPGNSDLQAGTRVSLAAIRAYDSASGQTLTYSASGLPAGLSISPATGAISGTLSATPAIGKVKVTVKDGTGASAAVNFQIVSVKALNSSYHPGFGVVKLNLGGKCMNDGYNRTAVDSPISIYNCQVSPSQNWGFAMAGAPGAPGRISIHGLCLYVTGKVNATGHHLVAIANCTGSSSGIMWELTGVLGLIVNAGSGQCLTDPNASTANNTQLTVEPCTGNRNQQWTMPASPITSGVAGKCLQVSGGHAVSAACTTAAAQKATLGLNGSLQLSGSCLYNAGGGSNDGTAVNAGACNSGSAAQLWGISAYGQIENLLSEKCLANPGNSTANGVQMVLGDCYNQPGDVWAVS